MEQSKTVKNQIIEGVIWKQLLLFFFPIVLGTFFQQLYNTADAIIVGRFLGTGALAAVGGSTELLIKLIIGFFVGISSGAGVLISQHYGAGRTGRAKQAIGASIILSLAGGALFMFLGIAAGPALLRLLKTPEEIMPSAILYLQVYSAGMIPIVLYNMGAGILRALGNSKLPLCLLMVCCLLNIVLDLLFVPVFHMGIFGAALATSLSQAVSAVLVLLFLFRAKADYRIQFSDFRLSGILFRNILRIGLPAGLQSIMYNFANLILQAYVNILGTGTVAAWTIIGKVDGIYWMVINALGIAVTTFIGQNYGAGKYERVKKSVSVGMVCAFAIILFYWLVCLPNRFTLCRLFSDDRGIIRLGSEMLLFFAPCYVAYVPIEILSSAIRGTGSTFWPMLINLFGICVLRLAWVYFMMPVKPDIYTVMASYPLSWVTTALIFLIYYYKGKWRRAMDKGLASPASPGQEVL